MIIVPTVRTEGVAKKFLLIEDGSDSVDIVDIAERYFRSTGFEITSCYDGKCAVAHLRGSQKFDAVICDDWLPDMTGLEMLAQVRDLRARMPFVLAADEGRIAQLGKNIEQDACSCVVAKPLTFEQLLAKIEPLISRCASEP